MKAKLKIDSAVSVLNGTKKELEKKMGFNDFVFERLSQMLLCMLTPKIAEGLAAGGGVPGRLSGRNP